MSTLVELCAGTAAVALRCLAGPMKVAPLTGYMGGKRRWAPYLADVLGFGRRRPDRVVLVDGGPWGDVWTVLRDEEGREATAQTLDRWQATWDDPHQLWAHLVDVAPPPDRPAWRVAQYLWLQARSAGCIPIWWSPERERWESPSGSRQNHRHVDSYKASAQGGDSSVGACSAGSRSVGKAHQKAPRGVEGAHQRGLSRAYEAGALAARRRQKMAAGPKGCRGMQYPSTIARRIRRLHSLPWDRVEVHHDDVRSVAPVQDATLYMDPPYAGCPRYAKTLPREAVLAIARQWHSSGCRVVLSEAEPLPLDGWHTSRLPGGRREVLTTSWPLPPAPVQLPLLAAS